MNLKKFFSRGTINNVSRFNGKSPSPYKFHSRTVTAIAAPTSHSINLSNTREFDSRQVPIHQKLSWFTTRRVHSASEPELANSSDDSELDSDDDGTMTEFLSRFVWIMRGKLSEVYQNCDKPTVDGMLLIIVEKVVLEMEKGGLQHMLSEAETTPSQDFSADLWRTVWEVSNMVLEDMEKASKKEKMREFIQHDEVKEMCRFAGEVGIRGDMLRELRFKWAREKMEDSEFYQGLERLLEEAKAAEKMEDLSSKGVETVDHDLEFVEEKTKVVTLPKRHGKIKYKIYGLDLSEAKWGEVADKIHEMEEVMGPQESKPILGKCKIVTEKILSLKEDDELSPLLAEWKELLQPGRIDWISLLDKLQEKSSALYLKVTELILSEESFQTNIRDYTKLIDAHAKENRLEDAERILKKMNESGVLPDILTFTVLVHMYSKTGDLDRAKQAFESLRSQGFQPDMKVYNSMIAAYVNAGQPKLGESLMREMEARDIKPTKEIYMALLRSFAQRGHTDGAQRILTTMQFDGFQPDLESCTLLVEAWTQAGDPDQARSHFDYMIKIGQKPDDRCTASMMAAYEKKNSLDKALNLLLKLEKDGFEPGVATYSVLVDWFGKLQLIDEAEQLLGKIAQRREAPPFKVHISLCDMYSKAGIEKKALQALGILEAKKDQLRPEDYERIINALITGGFVQDAQKMHELMEAQGFAASEPLKVALRASQLFGRKRPSMR